MKDIAKYYKAKEIILFDVQTNIILILVDLSLLMFVLTISNDLFSDKFSWFMLIITVVFIANFSVWLFSIKIYLSKGKFFSIVKKENEGNNHQKEKDNKFDVIDGVLALWMLGETVFISLEILKYARWTLMQTLSFFAMMVWIFLHLM